MAKQITQRFEAHAPRVAVEPQTGSATIQFETKRGPIELSLPADAFLLLRDRIEKMLAEERHGGLWILPAVTAFHGLAAGQSQSQLQIRLVLENGSEAQLPIEESALARLSTVLTEWFASKDRADRRD